MKNLKINLSILSLALASLLISCVPNMEDEQEGPDFLAREVISQADYYSPIPGNNDEVFAINLTLYSDGTAEAIRSTVSNQSSYNLINNEIIGASNIEKNNDGVIASFASTFWYIPFDNSQSAAMMNGGSSITVSCTCRGTTGTCDATITISGNGDVTGSCAGSCDGNCDAEVTGVSGGGSGVLVAATQLDMS